MHDAPSLTIMQTTVGGERERENERQAGGEWEENKLHR